MVVAIRQHVHDIVNGIREKLYWFLLALPEALPLDVPSVLAGK